MHKRSFVFFSAIALSICVPANSCAQPIAIKLDVLAPLLDRAFRISSECGFGNHFSAGLGYEHAKYAFGSTGSLTSQKEIYNVTGSGITPELRYYPFQKKHDAPIGFFIGAHMRYRWFTENFSDDGVESHTNGHSSCIGGHAGYKVNFGNFLLESVVGYGAINALYNEPNDRALIDPFYITEPDETQYATRFEIIIGVVIPRPKKNELSSATTNPQN